MIWTFESFSQESFLVMPCRWNCIIVAKAFHKGAYNMLQKYIITRFKRKNGAQSRIAGSFLFSLNINDMLSLDLNSDVFAFADDTTQLLSTQHLAGDIPVSFYCLMNNRE